MAINIHDQYPSNTASPTPEYPFGAFRDRSSPTSDDGTTLQQDWSNDFFVLQWRLLKEAGIVPNGEVDTVLESQYFEALLEVIRQNTQKLTLSDKYDGDDKSKVGTEFAVGEVYRRTVKRTGDTMTGSLNMRNESIPANNTGAIVEFSNEVGTGTFRTRPEIGNAQSRVNRLPSKSGTLVTHEELFGVGQNYINVTSTRKFNTPYQNTTGRTITVIVSAEFIAGEDRITVIVNNVTIGHIDAGGAGNKGAITFPVPPNSTYQLLKSIYEVNVIWAELR